mgnify:CR=1 FL=1
MAHRPEDRAAPADYVVVGASHKTSSAALRDRLFIEDADVPAVLVALQLGGFDQALVISTCDRVEFHGAAVDPDRAVATARDAGGVGSELESLLQHAYGAAKDVRANTAIAEGPVSLATAAVQAARNLFGSLDDVSALLIGPAEMGMLMLDQFRNGGLRRVTVAAGNASRGQAMARIVEGHSVTYDDLPAALVGADLVICDAGQTIERHITAFQAARAERDAVPVVADLRAHFEAVRTEVLADNSHDDADEITRRLINRLLHVPSRTLRAAARDAGADNPMSDAARNMFGLGPDTETKQDQPKADGNAPAGSEDE